MSLRIISPSTRIRVSTFILLLVMSHSVKEQVRAPNDKNREEAQRIWESAIAAKGGRERLHSVKNLVISSVSTYKHGAKQYVRRNESLFVLPDRLWIWNDQRPDVFGVTIEMCNFETKTRFFVNSDREPAIPSVVAANENSLSRTYGLLSYLMETNWFHPEIETVASSRFDNRPVSIIRTRLPNRAEGFETDYKRMDFVIDGQSHLPIEIRYYQTGPDADRVYLIEKLLDYVDIDGIKMPSRVIVNNTSEKLHYQLNVEFDPETFKNPPSISKGSKGWKARKAGQR